jgi:3-deoxy-D-manno-octulosonic-acid transferase
MLPVVYRAATAASTPLVRQYLRWRCGRGKEDPARFGERFGLPSASRPPGPLAWVHAASVGESVSVLGLIERLTAERPGVSLLMTTGTVAAARLMQQRLPEGVIHQFIPVDLPSAVERFLEHWRPGLALWVESELWPNLVLATRKRRIPLILLNARLSARSASRWRRMPGLIRPILGAFSLCLAQDEAQAERFRRLGARRVISAGDLKAAAAPLDVDPIALAPLRRQIDGRPCWVAASTHSGEEAIVAEAHAAIGKAHPGLLTIIAPRHPARGAAIAAMLERRGLRASRRAARQPVAPETDVYLADTMGELGLLFRLAGIAFIGGSLVAKGGHNPFEAARLDCAILHGPDMRNCAAMAGALAVGGAVVTVGNAAELAAAVSRLLADPRERTIRAAAAARVAEESAGVLDAVLDRLTPWLGQLAPAEIGEVEPARLRAANSNARA